MENETQPFDFAVIRIQDCGFTIQELIPPDPDKIQIGYAMNFLFDAENGWIEYVIKANFKHIDKNVTFLSGNVLTRFGVVDLKRFLDKNGKIHFPAGSLELLFGIAFGHLRALLAKNVTGSRFSQIIVPIVDPNTLFNELLQLSIEHKKNVFDDLAAKGRERWDKEIKSLLDPSHHISKSKK